MASLELFNIKSWRTDVFNIGTLCKHTIFFVEVCNSASNRGCFNVLSTANCAFVVTCGCCVINLTLNLRS